MKKTFLYLIIFCLVSTISYSQTGINLNPTLKSQVIPVDQNLSLGLKQGPIKLEFKERSPGATGYKSSMALPAKYDLRDEGFVTSAKDQSPGESPAPSGNCTAFASIGSIESRWLKMGLPEVDLSEQNLAACNGFNEENWGFGQGANQFVCSAYLTRMGGPILEADDPYNLDVHPCISDLVPPALVPDSRFLPVRDFELLKHTIYNYGAVYVGIHWDPSGGSFRATDNTYYYFGLQSANHAVLVCGWDDDKPTAGGTGAWIVKNSWGSSWADNGFFYISYQDLRFAGDEMAYYPKRWETNDVDVVFMNDELGFTSTFTAPNTSEFFELAKFTASSQHLVTHVGVCVPEPETVLDFNVYDDFDGETLSNLLGSRKGLYIKIPGIYTFELPVNVNGDFYIEVKRQSGENEVVYPVEYADEGFSDPAVYNPNVDWYRLSESAEWSSTDVSEDLKFNLTIRAYAKKTAAPRAIFTSNKTLACVGSVVKYTYQENNTATSWDWDFGEGADIATASTEGPHDITYSTEGTKTVKLIVSGPAGADTMIYHDIVEVGTAITVDILKSVLEIPFGESAEVTAYGADEYFWSPGSILDNATGQTVTVTPPEVGEWDLIVQARQGTFCSGVDTIKIKGTLKPENDDMCDALLITPGGSVGEFSNEFASPQDGEPAPDEGEKESGDCYAPMMWCNEDGVQIHNSLWFYFYGDASGSATLVTTGMDNQMAVYRADTCISIIKDSLVAANDDYSQSELAARLDGFAVVPGARYYVQIDGSFGGAKGTFELVYTVGAGTSVESIELDPGNTILKVYPNPGMDIFNVHLQEASSRNVDIFLYNLSGQLIIKKNFNGVSGEVFTRLDIGKYASGVYHLRIMDGDRIYDRKLVKK